MNRSHTFLYSLMPQILRRRDAEQGEVLADLLSVVQAELDGLEQEMAHLYDSWFIETCPDELIPALAQAVGIELDPVMPPLPSHRRLVANAVRYRNEKGTLGALAEVLSDASGWQVDVVEEVEKLAMTSSLRHRGISDHLDADFRKGLAIEDASRTVDLRPAKDHSPDAGGSLRALRIEVDQRLMAPVMHAEMTRVGPGRFMAHPLRVDTPTFERPTKRDFDVLTHEGTVGRALQNDVLEVDIQDALHADRARRVESTGVSRHWGPQRSLCVWLGHRMVSSSQVVVSDLQKWSRPGPNAVALMGAAAGTLTASAPEVELLMDGARKRVLKMDRCPKDLTEAATLLQRAIRKGAKDIRQKRCVIVAVDDRLLVLMDDVSAVEECTFSYTEKDLYSCGLLGLDEGQLTESHVLISREVNLRAVGSNSARLEVNRRGLPRIEIQIDVQGSLEGIATQLEAALRSHGTWSVRVLDTRLIVIPPPDEDAHRPFWFDAQEDGGTVLQAIGLETCVAVDAERGRVCLPIGRTGPVYIDWVMGLDSSVGSTPLPRVLVGPGESDWCVNVGKNHPSNGSVQGCYSSIEAAVRAWETQSRDGYIRVQDNGLYGKNQGPLLIRLDGRKLRIESESTGHPCLGRTLRIHGDGGRLALHGLAIDGGITMAGMVRLEAEHCTIKSAVMAEAAGELDLSFSHVISGPVLLPMRGCMVTFDTCIVDGRGDMALGGLDPEVDAGPCTRLARTTVIGGVRVCEVQHALDSLILGHVHVLDTHVGHFDHCAFFAGSTTPPETACIPLSNPMASSDRPLSEQTAFFPRTLEMGQPGYACAAEMEKNPVQSSASNGSEIGVFNAVFANRRMHMLRRMLSEFLPLGWSAHFHFSQ